MADDKTNELKHDGHDGSSQAKTPTKEQVKENINSR